MAGMVKLLWSQLSTPEFTFTAACDENGSLLHAEASVDASVDAGSAASRGDSTASGGKSVKHSKYRTSQPLLHHCFQWQRPLRVLMVDIATIASATNKSLSMNTNKLHQLK